MEELDRVVMQLIANGGDARSAAMEAVEEAKQFHFAEAEKLLKRADECLNIAHKTQTKLLTAEANGAEQRVSLLLVHAQDHFMNALTVKDLAENFVSVLKILKINGLKGEE